ncbi:MAG: hypothetical protein AAGG50_20620 [Bacteroidota bacterium]
MRLVFAFALLALVAPRGVAQEALGLPDAPVLWLGGGTLPGIGVHANYATPLVTLLTREVALYADFTPRVDGRDGELRVAGGVGGSLRVLRVAALLSEADLSRGDLDVGLRFGPAFLFALYEQTAASRARSFRVFLDPFVRGAYQFESGIVVYAEFGAQDPSLRVGFGLGL